MKKLFLLAAMFCLAGASDVQAQYYYSNSPYYYAPRYYYNGPIFYNANSYLNETLYNTSRFYNFHGARAFVGQGNYNLGYYGY